MKPVKILVAGTGNPHVFNYFRGANNNSYVDYIAVAEADENLRNQAKELLRELPEVQFYDDWRIMLDQHPAAEAVMVGCDNKYHFEVASEALNRGYHIYSMKVVTMDEDEGARLLTLSIERPAQVFQIELELHFQPQFQYARKLVEQNKLGKIESIYLTNISQSPISYFPNWGDPELSYGKTIPIRPGSSVFRGGALTDHPHPFDLIRWITGREFKSIYAVSGKNQRSHLKVEDHVAITGALDDGTKVFINPSYSNLEENVPKRQLLWPKSLECNLKITGDKGYYATDYFDKHLYVVGNNHPSPDRLIVDGAPKTNTNPENSLLGCFAACVRGARDKPESTLSDGLAAVKVMNACYESIATGKSVDIEPFARHE